MRYTLRNAVRCLCALAFAATFAAAVTRGQSRDPRIITARAGGVNFVAGDVKVQNTGQSGWQRLTMKDDLKSGDLLKSGPGGRVEVLLNPGSYLRLGENSELEMADASLETLRLKLYKGSAVIEATGFDDMTLLISLDTPQTTAKIIRRGIYRFNVTPSNITEVVVEKGRALVGKDPATVVKGGKVARVGAGGVVELAKFDKKMRDALDLWSKERGVELAQMNRKLRMKETNALLASTDFSRLYGRFGSFAYGVWVFNAAAGCYTFLPFYYSWNSPYGGWYGNSWGYYPGCYGCGSRDNGNNWPTDTSSPGPKNYPSPPPNNPTPSASNPIPVSKGSSGGDGIFSPSSGGAGKSKP